MPQASLWIAYTANPVFLHCKLPPSSRMPQYPPGLARNKKNLQCIFHIGVILSTVDPRLIHSNFVLGYFLKGLTPIEILNCHIIIFFFFLLAIWDYVCSSISTIRSTLYLALSLPFIKKSKKRRRRKQQVMLCFVFTTETFGSYFNSQSLGHVDEKNLNIFLAYYLIFLCSACRHSRKKWVVGKNRKLLKLIYIMTCWMNI